MDKLCKLLKASIITTSLLLIFLYVFNSGYDCNKNCIFTDVGILFSFFMSLCVIFLLRNKTRKKAFNTLVIFIPAFYVLYSGLFYIDSLQHEQQITSASKYLDFKLKYASSKIENISKEDLDKQISTHLQEYNKSVETYTNELLNGYKDIIGRTMMVLIIGMGTIMLLEILMVSCNNKPDKYDYIV